jgi:hypothetical protein
MSVALDEIAAGRAPDDTNDGVAQHSFDGFSVLVAAGAERPA